MLKYDYLHGGNPMPYTLNHVTTAQGDRWIAECPGACGMGESPWEAVEAMWEAVRDIYDLERISDAYFQRNVFGLPIRETKL